MKRLEDPGRRQLLHDLARGLSLLPLALADAPLLHAADLPLISEDDPAAKAVMYVADASRAKGAQSGATCANCSLYSAASGATEGQCTLFAGKDVKAAGWCTAWSSL